LAALDAVLIMPAHDIVSKLPLARVKELLSDKLKMLFAEDASAEIVTPEAAFTVTFCKFIKPNEFASAPVPGVTSTNIFGIFKLEILS
jgi:hypothetical protein